MPRLQQTPSAPTRPRKRATREPEPSPLPSVKLSVYMWMNDDGPLAPMVVAQTDGDMEQEFEERMFAALARELCDRLGIQDLRSAA